MKFVFIAIFSILLLYFFNTLIIGSFDIIIAMWLLLFFAAIFVTYLLIYLFITNFYREKVSEPIKFLIFILTAMAFSSYFFVDRVERGLNTVNQPKYYKDLFLNTLQDLPKHTYVSVGYHSFHASTDNLPHQDGKPQSFKWGGFELTSLYSENIREDVTAISLTQPKDLPKGVHCGSELHFFSKDMDNIKNEFSPETFLFSHCHTNDLTLQLNQQQIPLENIELHSKHYPEKLEKDHWVKKIKQVAAQLNLEEYWSIDLNGTVAIEKEWNAVGKMTVLFDASATPVALMVEAEHQTALNNTKLKQCIIQSSSPLMILTHLQNDKPTLLTHNLVDKNISPDCQNNLNVTLDYRADKFDYQANIIALLSKSLSFVDNKIYLDWSNDRRHFYLGEKSEENSFFWDKLKIQLFYFDNNRTAICVNLADSSQVKLANFNCSTACFKHKAQPLNNRLDYDNFKLENCKVDKGNLLIKNHPLKINDGYLSYADYNDAFFSQINLTKNGKNAQNKSEQLNFRVGNSLAVLALSDKLFYLEKAVINSQGQVIALFGLVKNEQAENNELQENQLEEKLNLGKCQYNSASLPVILKNFTDSKVDVLVFSPNNSVANLVNNEEAELCRKAQQLPYHFLF